MIEEHKQWIDNASYEQLLRRWRKASLGDLMFRGDTGVYYSEIMTKKRDEVGSEEHVRLSKAIGWG